MNNLWEKHSSSTMVNRPTFETNLDLAARVKGIKGSIVECGVWKGGMIAAIAETLGNDRKYFLCDSFQGLPPVQPIDGPLAVAWQSDNANTNCKASVKDARISMGVAGISNYQIVEGWFSETLIDLDTGPIALLRLDADWYHSTLSCLYPLFFKVARRGIVIIDDYYVWDGCSRAIHSFLASNWFEERIEQHNGVAYIVKR